MAYWLMKSEPDECSIDDALAAKERLTPWSGVRNYQARNFMKDRMKVGDGVLFYHSSCPEPGIYGLGNDLLDTPEVAEPKAQLGRSIDPGPAVEPLFGVLAAAKIVAAEYGTRCSTVLIHGSDGRIQFAERPFDASGAEGPTVRYEFHVSA